jgi:hypothetical protein
MGALERRIRVRSLLFVIGLSAVVSASVGFAAALVITPEQLTIHTAASSVPPTTCTLSTAAADTCADQGSSGSNSGTATNVTREWDVVADVRAFVAGTATNNGWRIRDAVESASGEGRFGTREDATASRRPRLVITNYP